MKRRTTLPLPKESLERTQRIMTTDVRDITERYNDLSIAEVFTIGEEIIKFALYMCQEYSAPSDKTLDNLHTNLKEYNKSIKRKFKKSKPLN